MAKNNKINVKGTSVSIFAQNDQDYISLTDMTSNFKKGVV
jgi:hypothetical protein